MVVIAIVGLTWAWYYYNNINSSEDPRVIEAKTIYRRYDLLANDKKYIDILSLLDSMSNIYNKYDDYQNSYEMGVVYNNKVAVLITIALFETSDNDKKDSLFSLAKENAIISINIYNRWIAEFGNLFEKQIKNRLEPIYNSNDIVFENDKKKQYLNKRTKDILLAQEETLRRLSVSYTNLGIILRHQNQYEEAVEMYQIALDLWSSNLTAENNINILLGRPIKERSVLEKLFPENK